MNGNVFPGRFTAEDHEGIVVFIIGMRINKWRAVRKWFPVMMAMPPMLKELATHKELGCLSSESFFKPPITFMVQYWRTEEELHAYSKGQNHLSAWKTFNKKAKNNDAVGIYHETYLISSGQSESIYVNMPDFGLGKALGKKAVTPATASARQRLKKRDGSEKTSHLQ